MPMLAGAFFIVAMIFFAIAIFMALPIISGDDTKPWKGLPVLFGFLFFSAAEFIAKGGMPS